MSNELVVEVLLLGMYFDMFEFLLGSDNETNNDDSNDDKIMIGDFLFLRKIERAM